MRFHHIAAKQESRGGIQDGVGLAPFSLWIVCLVLSWLIPLPLMGGEPEPDQVLARVDGREIRKSEVFDSIASLSLGDQIDVRSDLDAYIEAVINEEVLFTWALKNRFEGEEELRKEVKDLVVGHLLDKYVRSSLRVEENEVRAYYDANPSLIRGEHVRVRSILLKERRECERIMAKADSEEAFIRLAQSHSLDTETASSGGDSGLIMRGEGIRQGYEMAFFDMEVGEMRIFDTPNGCRVVRSIFYLNPPLPPYEQVRDNIRQFLENRREIMLVDALMKKASKDIVVERPYRSARTAESRP